MTYASRLHWWPGSRGNLSSISGTLTKYFDPFALETGRVSQEGGFDMDAMGVRVVKSKAKDFFYRRYGGFNSLVVKI